ncbi:MAG: hypothetical protein SGCHY_002981 [Lobulomycetales sp.]
MISLILLAFGSSLSLVNFLYLPLYFHTLFLIVLGLWCWALNLLGIDSLVSNNNPSLSHSPFCCIHPTSTTTTGLSLFSISASSILPCTPAGNARSAKTSPVLDSCTDVDELLSSSNDVPVDVRLTKSRSSEFTVDEGLGAVRNRAVNASSDNGVTAAYAIASCFSIVTVFGYIFFEHSVKGTMKTSSLDWTTVTENARHQHEFIVGLIYLALFFIITMPFNILYRAERYAVVGVFHRILFTGISSRVFFVDVILADILTSYSRVVGDLQLVVRDLVFAPVPHQLGPDHHHAHTHSSLSFSEFLVPVLICLPYLIRLRQCIAEYTQSRDQQSRSKHFTNACKYISSMPVILCSFIFHWLRHIYVYGEFDASESESIRGKFHWAIRFWILFSLVNSVFSIYWDLFMDWELFAGKRGHLRISTLSSFFQLRSVLVFKYPLLYYGAATLNVLMRLAWLVKVGMFYSLVDVTLSIQSTKAGSLGITLVAIDLSLKVLEILRRWIWVYLRVEKEWITKQRASEE